MFLSIMATARAVMAKLQLLVATEVSDRSARRGVNPHSHNAVPRLLSRRALPACD